MSEGENFGQERISMAAPLIFILVIIFQYSSRWLERLKKRASRSNREIQLQREIKQLLKEASTMSQPSTFAQAAKLRRLAAAKERELANHQQMHGKEIKLSYDLYLRIIFFAKVVTYSILVYWYWRAPVAAVSRHLVQPFGRFLSWSAGVPLNNKVLVGIIPWLILCTRVSKLVCRLFV